MIVLDTVTWIRLVTGDDGISDTAMGYISTAATRYVSAISAWELGLLVSKGRLELDRPIDAWVSDSLDEIDAEWADVTASIAALSAQLPAGGPTDPADRLIIATSLARGCALATPDRRIIEYPFVPTVW